MALILSAAGVEKERIVGVGTRKEGKEGPILLEEEFNPASNVAERLLSFWGGRMGEGKESWGKETSE